MSTLYIVRGLPGSGKSTLAKKLAAKFKAEHWEADMYFIKDGVYKFNIADISAAHEFCIRNVTDAMYSNVDVIVSNTFTRAWEMEDYLVTAEELCIPVVIIECTAEYGSIHDVPPETYEKMKQRWLPNDEFKKHITTFSNLTQGESLVTFKKAEEFEEQELESVES